MKPRTWSAPSARLCLTALLGLPLGLRATENGTTAFPNGAEDFHVAAMPPPGWYGWVTCNQYTADTLADDTGHMPFHSFELKVNAIVPRLDWIKPVSILGADIELLTWGTRGKPGLLFVHGNSAHADWWSFIAPFFADDYRVAALSLSGMGGSDWRETYSFETYAQELHGCAQAAGLYDGPGAPTFVGHSFGGAVVFYAAARYAEWMRAGILVDTGFGGPPNAEEIARMEKETIATGGAPGRWRDPFARDKPHRVYATLAEALARFRFMPPQIPGDLAITDFIARRALKRVLLPDESEGWTWRFDPFLWRDFKIGNPPADLAAARCPVAIAWGSESRLADRSVVAYMKGLAPAGAPMIEIPAAHHHVMVDQPLAFVTALRGLLAGWPAVASPDSNL